MLSIIIPAKNEEKYLPLLLRSIEEQEQIEEEYELIVADADSIDRTIEIAQSFSCRVIRGGLPAKGRNEGAKVARGDLLLFLDADIKLPQNFLKNTLEEFKTRNLDFASYRLIPDKKLYQVIFNLFYNWPITLVQKFLAHGAMAILVKRNVFEKIGGFEEEITLAEDHYFMNQAFKIGRFGIIKSTQVYMTLRRFENDGFFVTIFKYALCYLFMLSGKPFKSDILKYRFDHYKK